MQTQIRLPEGWEVRKLGDICLINPPKKEVKDVSDDLEVSFVPMSFVDDIEGAIKKQEIKKLAEVRRGYTYFKENDVLFAKITPCMENGKAAIAKNLKNGIGFGSTEFHVIRASEKALSEFIFYYIRRPLFRREAASKMSGTAGQLRVPKSFLEDYEIPLPSIEIQQKIVARLDAFFEHYNELKKEKQKAKEKYEQILQSAIASLIPQKELPEGWKKDLLVNLCSKKPQYGYTATCVKEKVGPIYLRIADIDFKGNVDWNNVKFVDLPKEEHAKFKLEKGDIVIARTGATAGKAYLFDEENRDMIFASYLIRFRCNQGLLLPEYLFIYMQSSLYWHHISKELLGTGQPNVNAKKLGNLEVVYPDIETQKEVISRIRTLKSNIGIITEKQKNIDFQLEQLPKAVLSKAFRGELVS